MSKKKTERCQDKRRKSHPQDKLRVVLERIAGEGTIADLCRRERVFTTQYYTWKRQLLNSAGQGVTPQKNNSQELWRLKEVTL